MEKEFDQQNCANWQNKLFIALIVIAKLPRIRRNSEKRCYRVIYHLGIMHVEYSGILKLLIYFSKNANELIVGIALG
jgi:hypothetical protein